MKKKTNALAKQVRFMKKRIKKTRSKAGFVGFLYLLGTILMAAAACALPLVKPVVNGEAVNLGITEFWKPFTSIAGGLTVSQVVKLAICAFHTIMLLTVVINVFRAFRKLGKLYRKKIDRQDEESINCNVIAMQKLGKIFSCSFSAILVWNFLIALFSENGNAPKDFVNVSMVAGLPNVLLVLAAGVVFHFICGLMGGKISLFYVEEEKGLIEQKREVGLFGRFVCNLFQVAIVLGLVYFFLQNSGVNAFVRTVIENTLVSMNVGNIVAEATKIIPAVEVVAMLCLIVLIKHATGVAEYNLDGKLGKGMKNGIVFAFFTFLLAAAVVVVEIVINKVAVGDIVKDTNVLYYTVGALGLWIIELMFRKAGKPKSEDEEDEDEDGEEGEEKVDNTMDLDSFIGGNLVLLPEVPAEVSKKANKKSKKK